MEPARSPSPACAAASSASMPAAPKAAPPTARSPGWSSATRCPARCPRRCSRAWPGTPPGRRYATLAELRGYAARVAGSVGAMMAVLMGARSAAQLARATDLGIAMQLTNIARDIGEDARAGRIYLPLDWLAAAGVDPDRLLADPRPTPALASLTASLLAEAGRLYARADPGIARLPLACRPAIFAASLIYAAIGDEIARAGHDSVTPPRQHLGPHQGGPRRPGARPGRPAGRPRRRGAPAGMRLPRRGRRPP